MKCKKSFMPSLWLVILATMLFSAMFSPPIRADDRASLQRQLDMLNQRVRILEQSIGQLRTTCGARVQDPSQRPSAVVAPANNAGGANQVTGGGRQAPPSASPGKLREKWNALRDHMTTAQVTTLLGAPSRKFKLDRNTAWYYDYPDIGVGSVMFAVDGYVTGWQRPPLGWPW